MYTYDETLDMLKEIADSKPDGYKYTTDPKAVETSIEAGRWTDVGPDGVAYTTQCFYRHTDGTPACIVGQLLYNLKPDFVPPELSFGPSVLTDSGIEFEPAARKLLEEVQWQQDLGETWKTAIEKGSRNAQL